MQVLISHLQVRISQVRVQQVHVLQVLVLQFHLIKFFFLKEWVIYVPALQVRIFTSPVQFSCTLFHYKQHCLEEKRNICPCQT